ncbi:hypothetical protein HT031_002464 [Scenedesmus sp. PABB004]|nr:hypothetical protein HT031_002464 [Scenedesmus sp. PABB004]
MQPQQQQLTAAGGRTGPRTWVLWSLFGVGWLAVLLFGLSAIPAFPGAVRATLYGFAWLFEGVWVAAAAWGSAGAGSADALDRGQHRAWLSNAIMAAIGAALGLVPGACAFAWRNRTALQGIAAAAIVFAVLHVLSQGEAPAAGGAPAGAADDGAAPAASAGAEVEGDKEE